MGPPLFLLGKECYLFTDSPPFSPAQGPGHLSCRTDNQQWPPLRAKYLLRSLDAAQARGLKLGWVSWRLPHQTELGATEFSEGNS